MMTDPFYMALLMEHLGQEYVVWDKSSQIRFRKPGRKDLFADFEINPEDLVNIKSRLESESKLNWEREVFVKDKDGTVIAEVNKVIYIARKNELPKIRNGK